MAYKHFPLWAKIWEFLMFDSERGNLVSVRFSDLSLLISSKGRNRYSKRNDNIITVKIYCLTRPMAVLCIFRVHVRELRPGRV